MIARLVVLLVVALQPAAGLTWRGTLTTGRAAPWPPPLGSDRFDAKGRTNLSHAAEEGDIDRAAQLLSEGAHINQQDKHGLSPLHWAVQGHQIKMLEFLATSGANMDISDELDQTPVYYAAKKNWVPELEALLSHRANPDLVDEEGTSPLKIAVKFNREEAVRTLLKFWADPNIVAEDTRSAVMLAAKEGFLNLVDIIVTHGNNTDLEIEDEWGRSALFWAAWKGHARVVEYLLKAGAQVDHKESHDLTPLITAASNGHEEVTVLLLKAGADAKAESFEGKNALAYSLDNDGLRSNEATRNFLRLSMGLEKSGVW